jgi:antitoxin ParD1/3/4
VTSIHLDSHFEEFIREQIALGRYQNASDVVREGLRLLEDEEAGWDDWLQHIRSEIDAAWDDPAPSIPADEAFADIEALHAETLRASKRDRG